MKIRIYLNVSDGVSLLQIIEIKFLLQFFLILGVVRCYNASTRKIILISPASKDNLENVTHLVAGCVTLPPSVYMNQEGVVGHIPYVFGSDLKDLEQMSKRTRIPFDLDKKGSSRNVQSC